VESLKWKVWHGKSDEAIERLGKLYLDLLNVSAKIKGTRKLH
jgi:hypothetical protein